MKIEFSHLPKDEIPEDLKASMVALRARYGSSIQSTNHTAPYADFGLMPYGLLTKKGWFWLRLGPHPIPRAFLREARELFPILLREFDWEVMAHVELADERSLRFARFFGFTPRLSDDTYHYCVRG